jgi:monoamine oxidase
MMKRICLAILSLVSVLSAEPKVIVIGGGLAGLTAAHRLYQKGIDTEVYEARNRVGGRVFTAFVGGKIGELGGQNISDGGAAENMHRLIDEFGLEIIEGQVSPNFYYHHDSKLIPSEEFFQDIDEEELIHRSEGAKNMGEVLDRLFDSQDPLHQTFAVCLECYEGGNIDLLSPLYVSTLRRMIEFSKNPKENLVFKSIQGGNALLPEKLALGLGPRVHLNKVLAEVSKSDGIYTLTFQDGSKVKTDILVLANPCSTYESIVFGETVIPEDRLKAMREVRYGTNAKILTPLSHFPTHRILYNNRMGCLFHTDQELLLFYYPNQASFFSSETIAETYRQDWRMIELLYPEAKSYLPEYARDEWFASYEGAVGYSWPNDPFARGSYSYTGAGQEEVLLATHEENGETVKTLFAPIDQTLYFAGEHTSILMDVPGTMESACESGERVARMIQKNYFGTNFKAVEFMQ